VLDVTNRYRFQESYESVNCITESPALALEENQIVETHNIMASE